MAATASLSQLDLKKKYDLIYVQEPFLSPVSHQPINFNSESIKCPSRLSLFPQFK